AAAAIDRERASLLASIAADEKREESIREQSKKVQERHGAVEQDRTRVGGTREALRGAMETRRARMAELEAQAARRQEAAAARSSDRRDLAERVSTLEHQFLRQDGRRTTLQEMDAARAGLGDAARDVLARRDAGQGFAGVISPLADLLETDRAHAAA